jgi:hypothetical protein
MTARRTMPKAVRADKGRTIVTDNTGTEFSFRGVTLDELEFTASKLEAEAKCAAKKAAYLRAAIALIPSPAIVL